MPSLDELRDVAHRVAVVAGYRLVVLFGSLGRGERAAGDIDLGVLPRVGHGSLDLLDATNRFAASLSRSDIDVVDLRRANPVLLMAVARDGIPLFEATPSEFDEFSSLAMRRYADTKKFRDAIREDLREYGASGRHGT